jgi:2-polyprenyl-3-methyl-5-hydroxy-6-metoxy-1,4-benzoquinol methylase
MDRLIKRWEAAGDRDLMLCGAHGVAYQRDMSSHIAYEEDYFKRVESYDGTEISKAVNAGRCAMLSRHLSPSASVLDWGAGSGAFVRDALAAGFPAKGYDVNPFALLRLEARGWFSQDPGLFDAVTLWDTIEHMEEPEIVFRSVRKGTYLFASIPVFEDLAHIRESRHYRPREHFYYWTMRGFVEWMSLYGFRFVEFSGHETDAGRESIGAFAFCRDLPDYHDHIAAYKEMHSTRHYGDSATDEYLPIVARIVKECRLQSILDYGCGRSDIAAHFWRDGERRIARYDPAIGKYKVLPEGKFDVVLACDLMEHIPMASVDIVLSEMRAKSSSAFFGISTLLARARLPDGRNAHVTLLTKAEWTRWIAEYFGAVAVLTARHEHELALIAGAAAAKSMERAA